MTALAVVKLLILALLPAICLAFSQENPTDRHILVLVDDLAIKSSHSIYFKSLTDRGFDLDFKLSDDPTLTLQRYGQSLYDGLILFAPSTNKFGGSVDIPAILEFVDSGHDLILAADTSASDLIRDIAVECGVDFDEDQASVVIDHSGYAVSKKDNDRTLIASSDVIDSKVILGEQPLSAPVLFRGIAHSVNPSNALVLKILSASPSAYSANPKAQLSSPPALLGSSISLVSVLQARNNARVLITGSLDLFSNKFIKSSVKVAGSSNEYPKSGNEQFVSEVSKWVFHERGHLRAVNVQHHKIGETNEPSMYCITDQLEYSVEIHEWTGKEWKPYTADDVQVQFYMMSPYVLKTLSHDGKGLFHTSFQVPDVYGVFQFKVEYQRVGYTSLSLSKQIPVRPFRHNEYERFIKAAYPYYGGAFSMMAGFFIFGLAFLYHK